METNNMAVKKMDPKMEKCITDCANCFKSCAISFRHCIEMGGPHALPKHLNLLKDCMGICKLSEEFMLRDSMHAKCICEECVKICELCAQSCEETDPNDEQMKECAKLCRECAMSCKDMVSAA